MTITAETATTTPTRILYPQRSLAFAADGTYSVVETLTPASMYRTRDGGLIFVKVDTSVRNDDTYRVHPTDTFATI